jgi:adenylate kinase family enzyme
MSKIIIIRGNSGSGKSTVAKKLQQEMGEGTMLIQQDVIRLEILKMKEDGNNPSITLIHDIALYGKSIGYDVIIEGMLKKAKHSEMFDQLLREFEESHVYYFDISFEETLKRHASKTNSNEFGEEEMKKWWVEKDYLHAENEKLIPEDMSEEEIIKMILEDVS